jgi:hypothetical protein
LSLRACAAPGVLHEAHRSAHVHQGMIDERDALLDAGIDPGAFQCIPDMGGQVLPPN